MFATTNQQQFQLEERLSFEAAALSIRGQQRHHNEDAVYEYTALADNGDHVGLYIVCDGMGGHEAGDMASLLTVDTMADYLEPIFHNYETAMAADNTLPTARTIHSWIRDAIDEANDEIQRYTAEKLPPSRTSGTTMTMAFVYGESVVIANIGDSRTYAWRNGELTQITRDHSLVASLVSEGVITAEEQRGHPMSNVILRAIGSQETVDVDFYSWHMEAGDKLLLCTDGLWQAFPGDEVLAKRLLVNNEPADLCYQLVHEANERDGSDNISAVVVTAK